MLCRVELLQHEAVTGHKEATGSGLQGRESTSRRGRREISGRKCYRTGIILHNFDVIDCLYTLSAGLCSCNLFDLHQQYKFLEDGLRVREIFIERGMG